jgi:prolyl oligopeptidase
MLLEALRETSGRLLRLDLTGRQLEEVPLPVPVTIHDISCEGDEVELLLSSPTESPGRYRHTRLAPELVCTVAPEMTLDADVRQLVVNGGRGVQIPTWLVSRRDADLPRSPVVLHVYGGFNKPWLPRWEPLCAALISSGVSYARPSLRGGGELGSAWWHAGRGAHRQRTFDDACSVAAYLGTSGYANADAIGLYGASYGGIVSAACVIQRPELFAAVVPSIGVYDLVRLDRDEVPALAMRWEFGDPDDGDQLALLVSTSPYHLLTSPTDAPPTLVVCGARDVRCPPWHSRKLAARLAQLSQGQVLLRVWPDVGHFTGAHRAEQVMFVAEPVTFLVDRLHAASGRNVRPAGGSG